VTIQAQILELLRTLQREQKMGLLLITHDLGVVAGMAHRVALMYAGQIIEVAPADEFFAAPKHPYARALLRALPDADRRGQPLEAIAGTVPPLWTEFRGCRFAPRCGQALPACTTLAPELFDAGAQRQVRCLLHAPAAESGRVTVDAALPAALEPLADDRHGAPQLLQVQELSVAFPIRKGLLQRATVAFLAVRGVNFEVARGRTLALVGESGCGKTTTGKAIVQLLRGQARIEGKALLEGRNLFELQGEALLAARRDVQIIFQDPFASLNPRMRVFELLEEGLQALHPQMDAAARRKRIEDLSERVGLRRDALERFPHEFSGGQRQRIAIARALAVQPKLVVCDEPTSALDVSVQAQILNLLRELQRDLGLSYLFITHNIGVVEYIADEVAVMRGGAIVEQGRCGAVLGQPQHAYTRELMAAVPRLTPID
jgi:peptide/nickel transport system ATP-binding protein